VKHKYECWLAASDRWSWGLVELSLLVSSGWIGLVWLVVWLIGCMGQIDWLANSGVLMFVIMLNEMSRMSE
jgi:hypothetical protein